MPRPRKSRPKTELPAALVVELEQGIRLVAAANVAARLADRDTDTLEARQ